MNIEVTIVKKGGAPVRYVAGDDPTEAAAIRTVDLQRRFRYAAHDIAEKVGLSDHQFYAVRGAVSLDDDPAAVYVFEFGSQKHKRYSDDAIKAVREFIESGKLDQAVSEYNARQSRPGSRRKQ